MAETQHTELKTYLSQLVLPEQNSRKGDNGKLLIIGGSELFHAASAWSLEVASRIVDMVFYSSIPENNALILESRKIFWDGIVIPRDQVDSYIDESDAILIGPGMDRSIETQTYVNTIVSEHANKRWIIDAGALQTIDHALLFNSLSDILITPHAGEFERVFGVPPSKETVIEMAKTHSNLVILQKGPTDVIAYQDQIEEVVGGNAGMTKGGTGDVLAGLVAGLATTSPLFSSAVVGSVVNKTAGESLEKDQSVFFNATELAHEATRVLAELTRNEA